jgi:hypothetical protein
MPFPVSVSDLWKMFAWANGQEAKNKKAVSEWLDAVYTDLEDFSRVWFRLCDSTETAGDEKEMARALKIINRGTGTNAAAPEGRIIAFYESASRALGYKRKADFHREFIDKLLDKKFQTGSLTSQAATKRLIQMRAFALTVEQDLLSLQALIKTFKAQS